MLSIIIPTYNEKKNIQIISKKLLKIKIVSEIIFVDDSSIDKTFLEIKKLKNKKIKGYLRKKNRDLSKSVIFGITKAYNKIILVMDCDLQHDVRYIPLMWNKFKKSDCDLVIASRFKKRSLLGNLGLLRSFISNTAIFMINFVFGKITSDPLSGFFMCKRELVLKNKKYFFAKGYKILFDILFNSQKNLIVLDQKIEFKKRSYEKSKFKFAIIWLFLRQMIYTKFLVKK